MFEIAIWMPAGIFGVAIGSFLNVCISRWPEGGSVFAPRSSCPKCGHRILWYENIPVVGWIALRARCSHCGERISPLYPAIELATAFVWIAAVIRYGASWQALTVAIFFTLLLGIATTDARTYIIPDEFTLGGTGIGLLLALAPGGLSIVQALAGAVFGFGVLYLTAEVGERWLEKPAMGGGDIKMMGMVGSFLGPLGSILTIFLGALIGSIVFVPISLRTHKLVPFGIFLAIGAAATEVWGPAIVEWYTTNIFGL
ncbi:MAG: prepilin peptidase [Gemmatimonas sp.]|nr:prepilin peptidase [Gemmatimonas sp.]